MLDYLRYYDLDRYLFEDVHRRFHDEGSLSAFDFFSIVIWKANRAKSRIANLLVKRAESGDLDKAVAELARSVSEADSPKDRLRVLMEDWGFSLPMASAVLAVLWPDDFTVYDVRVCGELDGFHRIGEWTRFDRIWTAYVEFCAAVRAAGPEDLSLRDKDRALWAKSSATQLREDIATCFGRADAGGKGR